MSTADQKDAKASLRAQLPLVLAAWGVGGVLAFYLSWRCNTNWNRGTFAKLVFGLVSGAQSWSYVMIYFWYKRGLCDPAAFHALPR